MKRFWRHATVAPLAADGFGLRLDGRPLRLPGGAALTVATRQLAEAIAAEWNAAGGGLGAEVSWDALPLSRLAGTAQERISPDPAAFVRAILRFGASDLLCYRAETPEALVAREAAGWQPWLAWLERRHGVRLAVTSTVAPLAQSPRELARLAAVVEGLSPPILAALGVAVPLLGSLVLGLALADRALTASEAFGLAMLDEEFQAERWGRDAEAEDRRGRMAAELEEVDRFLRLLSP
jgi:chaperone required for assembly of F1-ATPase